MKKGEVLRIEDVEAQQAIDFICYRLNNLAEKFWAAHSAKLNGTIDITKGHILYSDFANPMMTIVEDTVGVNDLICGSCSAALDVLRYGKEKAVPTQARGQCPIQRGNRVHHQLRTIYAVLISGRTAHRRLPPWPSRWRGGRPARYRPTARSADATPLGRSIRTPAP